MSLADLTESERNLALHCLRYIVDSDCFWDIEFHPRVGMERTEVKEIISKWPHLEDGDSDHPDQEAVNNCFNEVCHGLRILPEEWQRWFPVSREEVRQAFGHWRQSVGLQP